MLDVRWHLPILNFLWTIEWIVARDYVSIDVLHFLPFANLCSLELLGTSISNATSLTGNGGAILVSTGSTLRIDDTTVLKDNTAVTGSGGAVSCEKCTTTNTATPSLPDYAEYRISIRTRSNQPLPNHQQPSFQNNLSFKYVT